MIDIFGCNQIKILHEDRMATLKRDMRPLWRSRQPSILMPLRVWIGEQLIRLGQWVKEQGAGSPDAATTNAR